MEIEYPRYKHFFDKVVTVNLSDEYIKFIQQILYIWIM